MPFEPLDQYQQRQKKLKEIEALGFDPYPHKFEYTHTPADILERHGARTAAELDAEKLNVRLAGRILTLRLLGKAGFAHIQGQGKRMQVYVKLDVVGQRGFDLFKLLDLGDIIGVSGHLFRTKTGELSVWVEELIPLTKALLPLPEKWHGLADVELRYRRRYLDLIVNEDVRQIFLKRAQIIRELRAWFDARGFIEVETPMMHPIVGGAAARPFVTHHNALDIDLYLRIAPELYLKRLIVGGLDRVYEINRNFRNEGISTQHNPEFTMMEFYQAYVDYRDVMDTTEKALTDVVEKVCGSKQIRYGDLTVDFGSWQRLSMREAICKYWEVDWGSPKPTVEDFARPGAPGKIAQRYNAWAGPRQVELVHAHSEAFANPKNDGWFTAQLFERIAEEKLTNPTLIFDFPTSVSPLAKPRDDDPALAERFEIFVGGLELGNAYSELNDPQEQERRFRDQVERGGEEAPKQIDWDYVRALCHGLPPTGGWGLGIDRFTMLLTNSHSIREVILFPQLRPEHSAEGGE